MRNQLALSWLMLAALLPLLLAGCGKKDAANGNVTPAPPIAGNNGPPPTKDECLEFGKKLETAVNTGDRAAVDRLYRLDELVERSVSSLPLPPAFRSGVLAGVKNSQSSQFSQQLIDLVKKGGSFKLLRVRMEDNSPRVVMRQIIVDGGINYQELTLARRGDGQIVAEDIYVMLAGEKVSQTIRRLILKVAAEQDRGVLARLQGTEKLYSENLENIKAIAAAVKQNRNQDAIKTYSQLPAELQKDKTIAVMALVAAQAVGNEAYIGMMENFRRNNPDDAAIDLISIDYFLLKKQYDKCVQCIDRVSRAIGGDPYQMALKSNVLMEAGKYADAKTAAEKSVELEPKLPEGYWARITISLKEKNHADTLVWLKKIVKDCGVPIDLENVRTVPDYAFFATSPQFQEFKTWQKANP